MSYSIHSDLKDKNKSLTLPLQVRKRNGCEQAIEVSDSPLHYQLFVVVWAIVWWRAHPLAPFQAPTPTPQVVH